VTGAARKSLRLSKLCRNIGVVPAGVAPRYKETSRPGYKERIVANVRVIEGDDDRIKTVARVLDAALAACGKPLGFGLEPNDAGLRVPIIVNRDLRDLLWRHILTIV
jgi:hypothetical protein